MHFLAFLAVYLVIEHDLIPKSWRWIKSPSKREAAIKPEEARRTGIIVATLIVICSAMIMPYLLVVLAAPGPAFGTPSQLSPTLKHPSLRVKSALAWEQKRLEQPGC